MNLSSPATDNWTSKHWLYWLLVPCIVLLLVPAVVWLQTGQLSQDHYWQLQVTVFTALNQWLSGYGPSVWYNITLMGDAALLLPFVFLVVFKSPQVFGALWATLPIGALLSSTGKSFLAVPRPAVVLEHSQFTIIGEVVASHTSTPSGHSLTYMAVTMAVLATLIARPAGPKQWLAIAEVVGVSLLFCLSRVAVGAHWPLDLVVGASIGAIAGLLGAAVARRYRAWWQGWLYGKGRWSLPVIYIIWGVALGKRAMDMDTMHSITPITMYAAVAACFIMAAWPWLADNKASKPR